MGLTTDDDFDDFFLVVVRSTRTHRVRGDWSRVRGDCRRRFLDCVFDDWKRLITKASSSSFKASSHKYAFTPTNDKMEYAWAVKGRALPSETRDAKLGTTEPEFKYMHGHLSGVAGRVDSGRCVFYGREVCARGVFF